MVFVLQHQSFAGLMASPRDFLHGEIAPNNYEIVAAALRLQIDNFMIW